VAVIDEAQNLPFDALEELRMLSNLETEKSKLIQIVMVGQPNLRDSLDQPSLEQLRQRVTVRYHIGPLDATETAQYINHRLARAAMGAPITFPPDVTTAVYARSGGVPRMINVICDAVLLCGYAEEQRIIDAGLVTIALEELAEAGIIRPTVSTPALPAGEPWQRVATAPTLVAKPASVKPAPVKPIEPIEPRRDLHGLAVDNAVMRPSVAGPPSLDELPIRGAEPRRAAGAAPQPPALKVANAGSPRPLVSPQPVRAAAVPSATTPATFRTQGISAAPSRPAPPSSSMAARAEAAPESSAWSWLRQVLFGSAHEAGRR
jgi:general secretion pathway protein A